ncbi:hypothetical protein BZG36_01486 [Bifiguratus adelaidae]|uniref:RING-type domain-containing protein n=1 Tax=Bifiguratus adelaidae TaxID=1938954 RepID=A0A261Y4P1_9FUNG|nr:hypothetical protein BZG36_01486 [Bifiguratus adelaidae]
MTSVLPSRSPSVHDERPEKRRRISSGAPENELTGCPDSAHEGEQRRLSSRRRKRTSHEVAGDGNGMPSERTREGHPTFTERDYGRRIVWSPTPPLRRNTIVFDQTQMVPETVREGPPPHWTLARPSVGHDDDASSFNQVISPVLHARPFRTPSPPPSSRTRSHHQQALPESSVRNHQLPWTRTGGAATDGEHDPAGMETKTHACYTSVHCLTDAISTAYASQRSEAVDLTHRQRSDQQQVIELSDTERDDATDDDVVVTHVVRGEPPRASNTPSNTRRHTVLEGLFAALQSAMNTRGRHHHYHFRQSLQNPSRPRLRSQRDTAQHNFPGSFLAAYAFEDQWHPGFQLDYSALPMPFFEENPYGSPLPTAKPGKPIPPPREGFTRTLAPPDVIEDDDTQHGPGTSARKRRRSSGHATQDDTMHSTASTSSYPTVICPKCDGGLEGKPIFAIKPCGHVYCGPCIDATIKPSKSCGVCHKKIKKATDILQLFI